MHLKKYHIGTIFLIIKKTQKGLTRHMRIANAQISQRLHFHCVIAVLLSHFKLFGFQAVQRIVNGEEFCFDEQEYFWDKLWVHEKVLENCKLSNTLTH